MSNLAFPRRTLPALLALALLASHSTIVGTYFSGCSGGCTGSGSITQFYTVDHLICVEA